MSDDMDTDETLGIDIDDPAGGGLELSEHEPVDMPEVEGNEDAAAHQHAADLEAVFDVPVRVSAILGHSRMQVSELLKMGAGTVVELDRKVGEAIDIYVNNRLVARGEVVLVEDKLGVTMTEIIKNDR